MGKTSKKRKEKRGRDLAKELEKHTQIAKTEEAISKLKDEELFEVTDKSKGIKKKRYPLDPLRFKRKMWKFLGKSRSEAKMIEKLKKKLQAKKEATGKKAEPELMDLWADNPSEKNVKAKPFKSCLPAVVPPHGGQSYNPAADEYKDLLRKAVEYEKRKEQYDRKMLEILKPKKSLVAVKGPIAEKEADEEPKQEDDQENDVPMGDIKISLNEPVDDRKRKTLTKRNRERRSKALQKLEEDKKLERKKLHDINHLKEIIKEAKTETEELKAKRKLREEKEKRRLEEQKEGVIFGSKKIGRYKYEQQAVDFQLPEELPKKLAEIKVGEGSAVRNCYESILRRGLVQPPAEGKGPKKGKAKKRYKFSDKDYDDNNDSE